MNTPHELIPDDPFYLRLAAHDEACPDGPAPGPAPTPAVPDEMAPRWQAALDCLHLLAQARELVPPHVAAGSAAIDAPPRRLGHYLILKVLGSGSMGVVFLAEDPQLQRKVALKVMRPILAASPGARQRFLREARVIAAIKHDHIVTIHQVGETGGMPFLAMEWLEGESLADRLSQQNKLPPAEVVRVGCEIAEGLAAVHEQSLIHRDIKPGNIWLEGKRRRVKILDFGLARTASGEPDLTDPGAIVGTPAFMAPEQARGEEVDCRCDLFSLGSVLYRMATGELPFKGPDRTATLLALTTFNPRPPRELDPEIPPILSDLILTLLTRDPQGRPASARDVADCLRTINQVTPAPLTPIPGTGRRDPDHSFSRSPRNPIRALPGWRLLGTCALALLGLLAGGYFFNRSGKDASDPRMEGPRPNPRIGSGPESGDFEAHQPQAISPYEMKVLGGPEQVPKELVAILGNSRWRHWRDVCSVAFSFDGKWVVSGGRDGTARLWDAATGEEQQRFKHGPNLVRVRAAISRDGKRVATTVAGDDLLLWDPQTGQVCQRIPGAGGPSVAFSPTSDLLAAASGNDVLLLDGKEPRQPLRGHTGSVNQVAFHPDGKTLVSASQDGTIQLWDPHTGQKGPRLLGHKGEISTVAFHPNGKELFSGGVDDTLRTWDLMLGTERNCSHRKATQCIAISADGKFLATARCLGCELELTEMVSGKPISTMFTVGTFEAAAISPDSQTLITGDSLACLRCWDLTTGKQRDQKPSSPCSAGNLMAVSPNGKLLATAANYVEKEIKLWNIRSGKLEQVLTRYGHQVNTMTFCPAGLTLATADGTTVRLWDVSSGQPNSSLQGHSKPVYSLAFSPDGKLLASASTDGMVTLWQTERGTVLWTFQASQASSDMAPAVAFSPDGRLLVTGISSDNTVKLWETASRVLKKTFPGYQVADFFPDGESLALWGNNAVSLWHRNREEFFAALPGVRAAFSPDGKLIALLGLDGVVRVWTINSALGEGPRPRTSIVFNVPGWHPGCQIAFSPEGRHLLTLNPNGTIFILRLDQRERR